MSPSYDAQWHYRGSIIRKRTGAYQVETNLNGKRRRVTKHTRTEAEAYAKEMAEQAKAEGAAAIELSGREREEASRALHMFPTEEVRQAASQAYGLLPAPEQRADLAAAFSILRGEIDRRELVKPRPTPLAEAARFWLCHHPAGSTPPTMREALAVYLEAKKHRRPATLHELRNKLGRFCDAFPDRTIVDITAADIDDWLRAHCETLGSKRKYLSLVGTFYRFARRKWGIEDNPADGVYIDRGALDEVLPEAYAVAEVEGLLHAAAGNPSTSCIVPGLCVGFFAGLRPSELQALQWENIDFVERHITVRPETAKRRRRRLVQMSDNLVAWLAPYRRGNGPVCPPFITFRRRRADVMKAAGVDRWIRDGLRHTFASYHFAMYRDDTRTAAEMGHRGNAAVLHEHYRDLVKRSDAERFWTIRPKPVSQVVAFPKTA